MIKKRIYIDFIFNIIGSVMPIVFLQLLIQPIMAKNLNPDKYGVALTIISVANIIVQVSGTGINNTRIIKDDFYSKNKTNGDFNTILIILGLINIIVGLIWLTYVDSTLNLINISFLIMFIELGLLKIYMSAEYNINKKFKMVIYSNILLVLGYIVGLIFFINTKQWILIFLTGALVSIIYVFKTTTILRGGFKRTNKFKETCKSVFTISFSSLLISLVNYADRILLFPLVGSSQVAIYYTATTFGKILSMGLSPVSSVLLSYFSKDETISNKKFWKINIINFLLCIVFYIISIFISEPIIKFLYEDLYLESREFIQIANITAIINASTILIQPIILRFCNLNWQVYIQIIHLIIYSILSIIFVPKYGIKGFAYISAFISLIKLVILITIGNISFRKNNNELSNNYNYCN